MRRCGYNFSIHEPVAGRLWIPEPGTKLRLEKEKEEKEVDEKEELGEDKEDEKKQESFFFVVVVCFL